MTQNETKPWERPWSTKEMIENASDWNLAGDAGLLKYLEDFSEKMLAKAKDTNDKLNDLVSSADETSLALQNATNELMGLRNTQFIESRVYEDDETMPIKTEPEKEEPPKQTEADRLEEMKKAIFNGLEIIDKYYEKVEIPESDSEDDTDEPNIVYRRIDPYIDRPLPYVIGTSEWHKYWHVGLAHSSSESEVENEQEQFSETESEQENQNVPSRDRSQIPGISDSETEDLPKNKMAKPVANSTFNDNTGTKNMFDSSSDSETGSLPPQMNAVNNNFAEELAAKLGKVESSAGDCEVNTKPIRKQSTNISTGMFSDEPPPLDDDDIFTSKNMKSGLFSGGDGLFDDIDNDNDFWNTKSSTVSKPTVSAKSKSRDELFQTEDENDIFGSKKVEDKLSNVEQPKISGGLFDDDDDELFATASLTQPKKTILAPFKTTAPLLSDEPPELEPSVAKISTVEEPKRKKPIGGVSVLGPSDSLNQQIGKMFKNRAPSSSESETEPELPLPPKPTTTKSTNIFEPAKAEETKKIDSIFDDTSPLFNDDIFNSDSIKKFTSNLFDSEPPALEDELFKSTKVDKSHEPVQNEPRVAPKPDLEPPTAVVPTPKTRTLFSDNVTQDDDLFSTRSTKSLPTSEEHNPPKMTPKKTDIFNDDEDDDLFSSKPKSHDLFDPNPPALNDRPKPVDLFDPTPPELDESDTKSESHSQFSLDSEPVSFGSMNVARVSLFDNEPPLLSNESSGIVKDQSTRLDSEDSSFLPSMSSSRRQSDLFPDHQTSDSLFTSKVKQSIVTESSILSKSDLSKIPEHETLTKIEITPSGNESSLLDQSSVDNSVFSSVSTTETVAKPNDTKAAETAPKLVEKTGEPFKKQISLFDDEDDLFRPPKITEKPKGKTVSLFHESDSDDDLFANKSFGSKNSSSTEILNNSSTSAAKKSVKPLKNKNIFDDDLFSGPNVGGVPDVDLFKKSDEIVDKKSTNSENKMENEIRENRDDVSVKEKDETTKTEQVKNIANRENDEKKFQYEENLEKDEVKSVPKKSLSFEKNNETEKGNEETDGQIISSGQSPGKLKTNLQINVAALLPGAAPPRRQNLEKSVSLDSSENNQNSPEKYSKTQEKSPESRHVLEKSISFDCPIESNEILPSAAKERVKIPIKRRPSSRRARQEAIRKSAIDFDEFIAETEPVTHNNINTMADKTDTENILNITNNNVDDNTNDKTMNVNIENKSRHASNPLSPSTDEEDFFSIPRTQEVADNFAENSLFGKAPVISPTEPFTNPSPTEPEVAHVENPLEITTKVPASDKADLFSTTTKPNLEPKSKTKIVDTSIFSSSDSENDLFGSSKADVKKPKPVVDNNNAVLSSDEDLFKPVTTTSNAVASKSTINILAHQDSLFEEEDIFSTKKMPPRSTLLKKSLFDDDEDDNDDDIFGASSNSGPKSSYSSITPHSQNIVKKAATSSRVKKLSTESAANILDPLDALKK